MLFDVQSELGGEAQLLYVWMEIKERVGLMFKKELEEGCAAFKERGLLWSEKKVVGCTKYI